MWSHNDMRLPKGRTWLVGAALATFGGVLIGEIIATLAITRAVSGTSQALVEGVALSAGALVITVVAGGLALTTYLIYTGSPKLVLQIRMPGQTPVDAGVAATLRLPVSHALPGARSTRVARLSVEGATVRLVLRNTSWRYTARTPTVSLEFRNLVSLEAQPGWERVGSRAGGSVGLWWDGGADRSITARGERPLPLGGLSHAAVMNGRCELIVELTADGFRGGPYRIPIDVTPVPR